MLTPIQKGSPRGLLPPLRAVRRAPSCARPAPRSPIPTGLGPTELWIQQDSSGERVKAGERGKRESYSSRQRSSALKLFGN